MATKPRRELSAQCYLEPVTGWVGSKRGQRPRRRKRPGAFLQVGAIERFPPGATGGQGGGGGWALFSEGTLRRGTPSSQLLQAGDWAAAIFIPIFRNSMESAQETKAPESEPERIT